MAFGERGTRLWDGLSALRRFNPAELVVVEELCRLADRLDGLDALLSGDVECWARIEKRFAGSDAVIEVVLDDAMAEARQIAGTFQRLASSLGLPEVPVESSDGLDDLASRRASRRGA